MATIKDVAQLSGLSVGTVSRVFNNRGYISQETRDKVESACRQLGYSPNEVARSLFAKKTSLVALLLPNLRNPFYAWLAEEVEKELHRRGRKLLLCLSSDDPQKEASYFHLLQAQQAEGVIVASQTRELEAYGNLPLPVVAFDRYLGNHIPCVSVDHGAAGRRAAQILAASGCRKIAHLQGSPLFHSPSNERSQGFLDYLQEHHHEVLVLPLVFGTTPEQEEDLIRELLQDHPEVDGIFASDLQAARMLVLARKMGRKIPQNLKILGFDGVTIPGFAAGDLATFVQPVAQMAAGLVEILLEQSTGTKPSSGRIHRKYDALFRTGGSV